MSPIIFIGLDYYLLIINNLVDDTGKAAEIKDKAMPNGIFFHFIDPDLPHFEVLKDHFLPTIPVYEDEVPG